MTCFVLFPKEVYAPGIPGAGSFEVCRIVPVVMIESDLRAELLETGFSEKGFKASSELLHRAGGHDDYVPSGHRQLFRVHPGSVFLEQPAEH